MGCGSRPCPCLVRPPPGASASAAVQMGSDVAGGVAQQEAASVVWWWGWHGCWRGRWRRGQQKRRRQRRRRRRVGRRVVQWLVMREGQKGLRCGLAELQTQQVQRRRRLLAQRPRVVHAQEGLLALLRESHAQIVAHAEPAGGGHASAVLAVRSVARAAAALHSLHGLHVCEGDGFDDLNRRDGAWPTK